MSIINIIHKHQGSCCWYYNLVRQATFLAFLSQVLPSDSLHSRASGCVAAFEMSWFRFYKLYTVWISLATCLRQSDRQSDNCFCCYDSAKSDYVAELQTSKSILSHLNLDEASNRVCVPLSNSSSFSLASESLSCSSLRIVLMCCSLIRRFIRMQVASCCIHKSSCLSSPHDNIITTATCKWIMPGLIHLAISFRDWEKWEKKASIPATKQQLLLILFKCIPLLLCNFQHLNTALPQRYLMVLHVFNWQINKTDHWPLLEKLVT